MTLRLFQSKYFDTETLKVVLLYLFLGGFILSVHYFIFVEKAEASIGSGACSWHNGVDCNAGSDGDGSVICHDGWRDSSVGFYSVCDKGCPYGFTDEYNKRILDCTNKSFQSNPELEKKLTALNDKATQVRREAFLAVTETLEEWQYLDPSVQRQLRNQRVLGLAAELENYNSSIKATKDEIKEQKQDAKSECDLLKSYSNLYCKVPKFVAPTCPNNSIALDNSCECVVGYDWNSEHSLCLKDVIKVSEGQVEKKTETAIPFVIQKNEVVVKQGMIEKEDVAVDKIKPKKVINLTPVKNSQELNKKEEDKDLSKSAEKVSKQPKRIVGFYSTISNFIKKIFSIKFKE